MKHQIDFKDEDLSYIGHLVDQVCQTLNGIKDSLLKSGFTFRLKLFGKEILQAEGQIHERVAIK